MHIFFLVLFCTVSSCGQNNNQKIIESRVINSGDSLILIQVIPMLGVKGRIDHLAIDTSKNTLYTAAFGNNSVEILDLSTGTFIHSIKNISEPQNLIVLPDENLFCVSSGGSGTCSFYDKSTYALRGTIKLQSDADNMRYDAKNKLLYTAFGDGGLALIDPVKMEILKTIDLPSHPESFQLDRQDKKIFVNLPESDEIGIINLVNDSLTDKWKLNDAVSNFPMALDTLDGLMFIGCRKPPLMLVYDITSGKELTKFEIGSDADDIYFDYIRKYVIVTCGGGYLQVFKKEEKDHFVPIINLNTSPGSRTGLYSPEDGSLYIASPEYKETQAEIRVYRFVH